MRATDGERTIVRRAPRSAIEAGPVPATAS